MAETTFTLHSNNKAERYEEFIRLFTPFIQGEADNVTAMANTAAALHEAFGFFWVGFYVVKKNEADIHPTSEGPCSAHLQLGPFQGPVACSQIRYGRGVCGTAWQRAETIVVPDVELFPGHIACSSASRSEIVVPILDNAKQVAAVLDIDSTETNAFDHNDRKALEQLADILSPILSNT